MKVDIKILKNTVRKNIPGLPARSPVLIKIPLLVLLLILLKSTYSFRSRPL